MNQYKVLLLPGDGIGPEITEVTQKALEKISSKHNFKISFEKGLIGGASIKQNGLPLTKETLEKARESDAVLLAAIGSPEYDNLPREKRPETGLLEFRAGLDLFANIRPVKISPSLIHSSSLKRKVIEGVDLVVVRELTSGIYFGRPKGKSITEYGERAFNTMSYSSKEIDRISEIAFQIARQRKRRVCSVDKSNVLDVSQLWRERVSILSNKYPEVQLSNMYVDNASMQLIKDPRQFDVILTGNLFGDILSDEAAMLTGSIGMLPSASINNTGPGLFEPVHGSAPDIAGQNKANPMAMILSAAMLLRIGLKESKAADNLEEAVEKVLKKGFRTTDIMTEGNSELGCIEIGEEIINEI